MKLTMENIRSFKGLHEIEIKPITLLVGENSTGKSTLMSALSFALQPEFPYKLNFNEEPYNLGDFETIATNFGKKNRAEFFSIGFEERNIKKYHQRYKDIDNVEFNVKFISDKQQKPLLKNLSIKGKYGFVKIEHNLIEHSYTVVIDIQIDDVIIKFQEPFQLPEQVPYIVNPDQILLSLWMKYINTKKQLAPDSIEMRANNFVRGLIAYIRELKQSSISIAPIRVKPKRTYDIGNEIFNPEGEHIPYILSRILEKEKSNEKLFESILKFGQEAKLFEKIQINRFGGKINNPFQIQIKLSKSFRNIIDVGYGVSQSLPILIQSILGNEKQLICLQQPEVHLHPRAQAALGSFFVDVNRITKKNFVIETHSDYLIDRVRMEVAEKKIKAQDVTILYFEMSKGITKIHPLELDSLGNITNAPVGYRDFFMEEGLKLLRRGD